MYRAFGEAIRALREHRAESSTARTGASGGASRGAGDPRPAPCRPHGSTHRPHGAADHRGPSGHIRAQGRCLARGGRAVGTKGVPRLWAATSPQRRLPDPRQLAAAQRHGRPLRPAAGLRRRGVVRRTRRVCVSRRHGVRLETRAGRPPAALEPRVGGVRLAPDPDARVGHGDAPVHATAPRAPGPRRAQRQRCIAADPGVRVALGQGRSIPARPQFGDSLSDGLLCVALRTTNPFAGSRAPHTKDSYRTASADRRQPPPQRTKPPLAPTR